MVILGIDPGSRSTGYGIIRKEGPHIHHIDNGLIKLNEKEPLTNRLVVLFKEVQKIVKTFSPEILALENIFYSKNIQSTLKLGHARGSIIVATGLMGLKIFEYTPLAVKQAITGYGGATKEQVQKMVKALLKLPQIAEENASDALAAAICHAHSSKLEKLLKAL